MVEKSVNFSPCVEKRSHASGCMERKNYMLSNQLVDESDNQIGPIDSSCTDEEHAAASESSEGSPWGSSEYKIQNNSLIFLITTNQCTVV